LLRALSPGIRRKSLSHAEIRPAEGFRHAYCDESKTNPSDPMKITQQTLFIALAPFLAQTAVIAEPEAKPDPLVPVVPATKDKAIGASWRASEIIGTNVKNAEDETIGEIQDLVVDFISGEVLAVVIASGGFLGMADTLSAVPVSAVRYDVAAKAFKTKLTKEQLVAAPNFKKSEWPNYGEETTRSKLKAFQDSLLDARKEPAK
jgi:sporulation protein YlmC with PRC-barrel domain